MTDAELKDTMRPLLKRAWEDGRAFERERDAATFSAPFASAFSAADATQFCRYFADTDGLYPGSLHRHFGLSVREFADRAGVVRKQITDSLGRKVWHWVRTAEPPKSPESKPADAKPTPAADAPPLVPQPQSKLGRAKAAVVEKLAATKGGRAVLAMGRTGAWLFHAIEHRAMFAMKKVQELSAEAAKERGLDEEKAARLKRILYAADFMGGYVTGAAATAAGLPVVAIKGSMFLPSASVAYLAYSTLRNPLATWRAALAVVKRTFAEGQPGETKTHAADPGAPELRGLVALLAERLASAADGEWYTALLHAALAQTRGDLARAIRLADAALADEPKGPEGDDPEEGGADEPADEDVRHFASASAAWAESKPEGEPATFAAPGPPPRPNWVWHEETHHWRNPENWEEKLPHSHQGWTEEKIAAYRRKEEQWKRGDAERAERERQDRERESRSALAARQAKIAAERQVQERRPSKAMNAARSLKDVAKRRRVIKAVKNEGELSAAIAGHNLPDSEPADVVHLLDPTGKPVTDPAHVRRTLRQREQAVAALKSGVGSTGQPLTDEQRAGYERILAQPAHFFEVKTLLVAKGDAVHMSKPAMERKQRWMEKYGISFHTVAIDDRRGSKFSGNRVYVVANAFGSTVRLDQMQKATSMAAVLELVNAAGKGGGQ